MQWYWLCDEVCEMTVMSYLFSGVSSRVHGQDIGSSVSDEQTKEFLEDMAELKHDEWDELGSDFEMVLSDCPENSNCEGEGPYSFSG